MNDRHPNEESLPWYRHRWPWILMAGPVAVVIAGVFTAYLAIVSNDGLVEDDYYKKGLAINQTSARDQRAAQLGLRAELMGDAGQLPVRLFLRAAGTASLPGELRLRLVHPTRAGIDQDVLLKADGGGLYSGQLKAATSGRWHVVVEDNGREWRLTGVWTIGKDPVLRIPAG